MMHCNHNGVSARRVWGTVRRSRAGCIGVAQQGWTVGDNRHFTNTQFVHTAPTLTQSPAQPWNFLQMMCFRAYSEGFQIDLQSRRPGDARTGISVVGA